MMIGKTTILAVRTLIHLGQQPDQRAVAPRGIAGALAESPSYLAKVARLLVRAGILRAAKGVRGGVYLARPPREVTLLDLVEACQGTIVCDHCEARDAGAACAYHAAAEELRAAVVEVLSRWTVLRLMERPGPLEPEAGAACLMTGGRSGNRERGVGR